MTLTYDPGPQPEPEPTPNLDPSLAARLVDTPPEQLTTTAFVHEAQAVATRLRALGREIVVEVISGDDLRDKGYGGLHGVGRAASEPPALCVLSHVPAHEAVEKVVCLVGKGIVYDTGGLALKSTAGMVRHATHRSQIITHSSRVCTHRPASARSCPPIHSVE